MLNVKVSMVRFTAIENTVVRIPWGWLTVGSCFGSIDVGGACYVDMDPKCSQSPRQLAMFVAFKNISQAKARSTSALFTQQRNTMYFSKNAAVAMQIGFDRVVVFEGVQILSKFPGDLQHVKEENRQ